MKKPILTMLTAIATLFTVSTTKAQVSFSLHIGTPPVWAPPAYAHTVRYYYIPEMDCYYDASRAGYYYNDGYNWRFSAYVPEAYRGYDVSRFHHVVVNYYGERPYTYFGNQRYAYVQRYHPAYAPVREYRHDYYDRRDHWDGDRDGHDHWNGDHDRGDYKGHEDGRGRWHDNGRGNRHDD